MNTFTQQEVLDFLKSQMFIDLAVSSNDGTPFCCVVTYFINDNYEFTFVTHKSSRKAQLLLENPKIAGTISHQKPMNIQLTGTVQKLPEKQLDEIFEKLARVADRLPGFYPPVLRVTERTDYVAFRITPDWLRAMDLRHPTIREQKNPFTVILGE